MGTAFYLHGKQISCIVKMISLNLGMRNEFGEGLQCKERSWTGSSGNWVLSMALPTASLITLGKLLSFIPGFLS